MSNDDIRRARAVLAWVIEPDHPWLPDQIAAVGAVQTLRRAVEGGLPAEAVRVEVRGHDPSRVWAAADRAVDATRSGGLRLLTPEEPHWPHGLRRLPAGVPAPICLWARGPHPVPDEPVAVVGASACTAYGAHLAGELAAGLAAAGRAVLTCAGFGVPAAALRAALAAGRAPVVVLPCGLDRPFPPANADLITRVADAGTVISMYPPGAPVSRRRAVAARRLIAALAAATVLVEAHPRSGDIATARHALDAGRAAMVVPGPVTSVLSAGCHALLRDDRRVRAVTSAADIIADLTTGAAPSA